MLPSLLASQVISIVPAAVLLSGFTQDGQSLLVGINLGSLGTLAPLRISPEAAAAGMERGEKLGQWP